ncbi:DNA cytosine methyltransferase [Demequina litorisediminis]|uniref:DNA cytosine methyltransferase n=1 Tax=Demequina litorisediminis TaxID=1849022 RepID=UPI003D679717
MAIGDDLTVIREIADILEGIGYVVDYRLLDAWRHGVPQHRKRFILQARRDGVDPMWPELNSERPTVRDAIADLPALHDSTGAREPSVFRRANQCSSEALAILGWIGRHSRSYDAPCARGRQTSI